MKVMPATEYTPRVQFTTEHEVLVTMIATGDNLLDILNSKSLVGVLYMTPRVREFLRLAVTGYYLQLIEKAKTFEEVDI